MKKTRQTQTAPGRMLVEEFYNRSYDFASAVSRFRETCEEARGGGGLSRRHRRSAPDRDALRHTQSARESMRAELERVRGRLHALLRHSAEKDAPLYLARLAAKHKLDATEQEIVCLVFQMQLELQPQYRRMESTPRELALLLAPEKPTAAAALYRHFYPQGALQRAGILYPREQARLTPRQRMSEDFNFDDCFRLSEHVFLGMLGENAESLKFIAQAHRRRSKRVRRGGGGPFGPVLRLEKPRLRLDDIVLPEDFRERLEALLLFQRGQRGLRREWGLEDSYFKGLGTAALLSGPPGTGKTLTAMALAGELGRPLGIVRYDTLFSMWVGGSEKQMVGLFEVAAREKAVLLFDECDALVHERGSARGSEAARAADRMVNLLLQRMELHDGLMLFTTNHAEGLDPAIDRRLSLRLEYPIPGPGERALLWKKHLPAKLPLAPEVDCEALGRGYALSGGYIKNAIAEALRLLALRRMREPGLVARLDMALLEDAARSQIAQSGARNRAALGFSA